MKSLTVPIKDVPVHDPSLSYIDVVIDFSHSDGTIKSQMIKWNIDKWQSELVGILNEAESCYYIDVDKKQLRVVPNVDVQNKYSIICIDEIGLKVLIPALTFMRFNVKVLPPKVDPIDDKKVLPLLVTSFKHELSEIGRRTLKRVERDVLQRYKKDWIENSLTCLAPLVSLCQSSGTGKSKIAMEIIKKNLGFYVVFRSSDQTGYPRKNIISNNLRQLISSYNDGVEGLESKNYEDCAVGKILNFIASLITKYVRDFVDISKAGNFDFAYVTKRLGARFEDNITLGNECLIPEAEMKNLYFKLYSEEHSSIIKVKTVAKYIDEILLNPAKCLSVLESDDIKSESICQHISEKLSTFPFVLVIDEAELLAEESIALVNSHKSVTGFQVLRRALSYLEKKSKIIVLTLGTKSNVLDLNPPVEDNSKRFSVKMSVPDPIILSSNLNILSKEYSVKYLKPGYKLLTNPLFYKYLVTRGHGIWSSLPYNGLISIAESKIKNGTSETHEYILALWMILTGLAANPLSVEAKTLVSSHMAHLVDLRDKISRLIVAYPSEPILGIVAHRLIDELEGDELFSVLRKKYEAVDLDNGSFAETFAEMIFLRAIHKSKPYEMKIDANNYERYLDEIIELAPGMVDLWETHSHVLEDSNRSKILRQIGSLIRESLDSKVDVKKEEMDLLLNELKKFPRLPNPEDQQFEFYKVHTLGGILTQLCGIEEADLLKYGLPSKVLNAIVTANRFVRLNRFYGENEGSNAIPVADNRIPSKCRSLDSSILRLAALEHAGIIFEPGYFGFDFGIPYCMEGDIFGFLGVQVKRSGSNLTDDLQKMQARFHMVKCPNPSCNDRRSKSQPTCPKCTPDFELETIFENQVSIIMTLDENYTRFTKQVSYSYANGLVKQQAESELLGLLTNNGTTPLNYLGSLIKEPCVGNILNPLAQLNMPLSDDVMFSMSLWNDNAVNLKSIKFHRDFEIPFIRDGFNHRQFTFTTRGWQVFERTFRNSWPNCIKIANELLTGPKFFKSQGMSNRLKRQIIHDFSFSFVDYSDDLSVVRGNSSKLDELDIQDGLLERVKAPSTWKIGTKREILVDITKESKKYKEG